MRTRTLLFLLGLAMAGESLGAQTTQLYALRYGVSMVDPGMVIAGKKGAKQPFHWLFYAYKTDNRVVLIDCGYTDPMLGAYFNVTLTPPLKILSQIGIEPGSVTDVIISHAHFDHMGSVALFPNARIWIHKNALAAFLSDPWSRQTASFLKNNPKVTTFSTETSPVPGIDVIPVEGHTAGSCAFRVDLPSGTVIITGDECYSGEGWRTQKPSGAVKNLANNVAFLKNVLSWSKNPHTLVVTMHDTDVVPANSPTPFTEITVPQ